MRVIHSRAPKRCSARLLGTSNTKYPMKNSPAPSPYIVVVSPMSLFMVRAAKPTLVRSR